MEKEQISYYDVYKPYKILKMLQSIEKKHFVYKFIKKLKAFL